MYDLDNERKLNPEGGNDEMTERRNDGKMDWRKVVTLYVPAIYGGGKKLEKQIICFRLKTWSCLLQNCAVIVTLWVVCGLRFEHLSILRFICFFFYIIFGFWSWKPQAGEGCDKLEYLLSA